MIKHVVCFKLNECESAEKAKEVLSGMKGKVPQIREMEVGIDFLGSARSFDVYLSVVVDDKDALNDYQNDPYHVNVVKKHMHSVTKSSVAVDFVIEK